MDPSPEPRSTDSRSSNPAFFIAPALLVMVVVAILAFRALKPSATPPPVDIASDPLLVEGRTLFLDRCASCHGQTGHGDGPIARTLKNGKAGDFSASPWKYGEKADDVRKIIAAGTPDGQMPGWGKIFSGRERDAVASYAFYLGKRPVPGELRGGEKPTAAQ